MSETICGFFDYEEPAPISKTHNKKQIRDRFREVVLKRDEYKCVMCGYWPQDPFFLDVHHITDRSLMPNGGYSEYNGITLCCDRSKKDSCHEKAEWYHARGFAISGYSPDNLYDRINSSYTLGFERSILLSSSINEVEILMACLRKTKQQEEKILKALQSEPNETTWELACDALDEQNEFIKNFAKGRYVDLSDRRTKNSN